MAESPRDITPAAVLGLVTGGLAHDLNNLLSPILLGVQTLQRNDPDDKTKRILSMIELSSRRAADLIRHLLEFSRNNRATQVQQTDAGALPDLFGHALSTLHSEARDVESHYDPNLFRYSLNIAPDNLQLVLQSVLRNAWDSSGDSPQVEIQCSAHSMDEKSRLSHRMARSGQYCCIRVSDKGCGIAEEHLKHICEPFYSTHRDAEHAGLGLFVVATLLKHADGFVEFEPGANGGTTVLLYIPMTAQS